MKKFKGLFLIMLSVFLVTGCTINNCPKCEECTKCEGNSETSSNGNIDYKALSEKGGVTYVTHKAQDISFNGSKHTVALVYTKGVDRYDSRNDRYYTDLYYDNILIKSYDLLEKCNERINDYCHRNDEDLLNAISSDILKLSSLKDVSNGEEYLALKFTNHSFNGGGYGYDVYVLTDKGYNLYFYEGTFTYNSSDFEEDDLYRVTSDSITYFAGYTSNRGDADARIKILTMKNGRYFIEEDVVSISE